MQFDISDLQFVRKMDCLCFVVHYFVSFLALQSSLRGRERADGFAFMSSRCLVTVNVLWLFLKVPWVCLQCLIVVFPDHTHLLKTSKYQEIELNASITSS